MKAGEGPLGVPTDCNFCQGKIMWLRTDAGRLMPVDAHPDPERGNVRRDGTHATVLDAVAAPAQRAAGVPLRVHHAASCPYADKWRSGPKPRAERRTEPATEAEVAGLW